MRAEKGFTLIEVVVAITCSTLLFLALFSTCESLLSWMGRFNSALERDENLDLAPLILAPLLTQAGNNYGAFPQAPIELREGELVVRSDISGTQGFPDGDLDDPFELCSIRQSTKQLQIKSGRGSYQPLLNHVAGVSWFLEGEGLLNVNLEALSSGPGSGPLSRRRLELTLFLPNLQPSLFGD